MDKQRKVSTGTFIALKRKALTVLIGNESDAEKKLLLIGIIESFVRLEGYVTSQAYGRDLVKNAEMFLLIGESLLRHSSEVRESVESSV